MSCHYVVVQGIPTKIYPMRCSSDKIGYRSATANDKNNFTSVRHSSSSKKLRSAPQPQVIGRKATQKQKNPRTASQAEMSKTTVPSDEGWCFFDAIAAMRRGSISEEEYFNYLIVHYQGVRHEFDLEDNKTMNRMILMDPVASEVYDLAIRDSYDNFSDIEVGACRKLFQFCAEGELEQFRAIFEELSSRRWLLLQPTILLAVTRRQGEIFRYCVPLAKEAGINIRHAVRIIVFRAPEILDFLLELNWENIQNSPRVLNHLLLWKSISSPGDHGTQVLRWLLDHGAKIPGRDYLFLALAPPPLDMIEFLLVRET